MRAAAVLLVAELAITIVILFAAAPSNPRPAPLTSFPTLRIDPTGWGSPKALGMPTALAADDGTIYVAMDGGYVIAIKRKSQTPILVGQDPTALALSPDRLMLYVHNADGSVTVIRTHTNSIQGTVNIPGSSGPIAFTPSGSAFYVSNAHTGTVTPVSTDTGALDAPIPTGGTPYVLTAADEFLYVSNASIDAVTIVAIGTGLPQGSINVGCTPHDLALSPDGGTLYVYCGDGAVRFVNLRTGQAARIVNLGTHGEALAVSRDGQRLYVANNLGSSVWVISTVTGRRLTPIPVGSHPDALAITPDGTLYVANSGSGTVTVVPLQER